MHKITHSYMDQIGRGHFTIALHIIYHADHSLTLTFSFTLYSPLSIHFKHHTNIEDLIYSLHGTLSYMSMTWYCYNSYNNADTAMIVTHITNKHCHHRWNIPHKRNSVNESTLVRELGKLTRTPGHDHHRSILNIHNQNR